MSVTVAFVVIVVVVIGGGWLFERWDTARNVRVPDGGGTSRAVVPLARFEARKALLHPTWLVTLLLVTALTTTLLLMEESGSIPHYASASPFALLGLPLAALALVVSLHRIGTRDRRHRTDEIEGVTPTAPRAHTAALLLACLAPLPVAVAVFGLGIIVSQLAYSLMPAPSWSNLLPFAGFLLAVVGGAVVGVLLSRWLPVAIAPILGLIAILYLNNGPDHLDPRFRWLRVAVEQDYGGIFDVKPLGWSVMFVSGLIALGCCLALWRHPPRPGLVVATGAAAMLIVTAGWTMTRTPSEAEIAERVDMLEHPRDHQSCEVRGVVEYCVYRGAEPWVDAWHPAVEAVLDQAPPGARPARIAVVQRASVGLSSYLPEVAERVDPLVAWRDDGKLHPPPSLEDERTPDMTIAWQTAALIVGLPPSTSWDRPSGCLAGGQARLVLVHVLSGRATATTRLALKLKATDVRAEGRGSQAVPMDLAYEYEDNSPSVDRSRLQEQVGADLITDREYTAVAGASGWGSDVLAASQLVGADRARVDRVIDEHWEELVDPMTSTTRFLELAGIDHAARTTAGNSLTAVGQVGACP